ncbi:MAG: YihY/virulence factor BrkB family protein [Kiritimatiellia bacterium]
MIKAIKAFFIESLWRVELADCAIWKRFLLNPLRFTILTVRIYLRDGALLHASALTYITMLAIVPVLALGLTSLKTFGARDLAERKIMAKIDVFAAAMEQNAAQNESHLVPRETTDTVPSATDQSHTKNSTQAAFAVELRALCQKVFKQIDSINFAKIGTVGAVALIFMVIGVLGKIENSFNMIWEVAKPRPLWRKFTDYLSVIIIVPLLLLASTSLPVLDAVTKLNPHAGKLATFITSLGVFNLLVPFIIGVVLFAFLFGFLPNTKIRLSSCFLGAIATTLIITVFFKLCVILQVGIANNSALYGSLIALPILLFWIYSSWQIILFGAEICYVHQHHTELVREYAFSHPSERDSIVIALALVLRSAQSIQENNRPLNFETFAKEFALPARDIVRIAALLERNHILIPVSEGTADDTPSGYVLSRCSTQLKISDIINACLDNTQGENVIRRSRPQGPLVKISEQFSTVLTSNFQQTIAEVLLQTDKA